MDRKLKFAIVGCGRIARRHAEEAARIGHVAAVCDIVREKADLLAGQYGSIAYYRLEDLLSQQQDLDIISVCTPNGLHAKHSIQSLDAGIHVLCEKPMAIASIDAAKMIEAAERNNRKLHVVKQNRFNPPVIFAKNLVTENKLGDLVGFQINCFWNRSPAYYKNGWHGSKDLDGGILYTQFSHFIDILYWFLGDLVSAVGMRSNRMHGDCIEFEDNGMVLLEMRDQVTGSLNYNINSYAENMEGSFTIFGKKGTLKIGGQYLNELAYFSVENEGMPVLPHSRSANHYGFYEGSMSNHDKVFSAFTRAIADPGFPLVSAYDTMKTVEIIEKIYKSSPFL